MPKAKDGRVASGTDKSVPYVTSKQKFSANHMSLSDLVGNGLDRSAIASLYDSDGLFAPFTQWSLLFPPKYLTKKQKGSPFCLFIF